MAWKEKKNTMFLVYCMYTVYCHLTNLTYALWIFLPLDDGSSPSHRSPSPWPHP